MEHRESVVLVDSYGSNLYEGSGGLSVMGKMEAHRLGLLHRAISVFVFNDRNELLLQQRTAGKYHSPCKWTNTCCTHPFPEETPLIAAQRRLKQEMGMNVFLTEIFTFLYKADVGNGLTEHEFDHVFFGVSNQNPVPDPAEVSNWNWIAIKTLERELIRNPDNYTPWLQECFYDVVKYKFPNIAWRK